MSVIDPGSLFHIPTVLGNIANLYTSILALGIFGCVIVPSDVVCWCDDLWERHAD